MHSGPGAAAKGHDRIGAMAHAGLHPCGIWFKIKNMYDQEMEVDAWDDS